MTLYKIIFEIRGHGDHIINGMTFYISAPNKKIAEMIIFHNLEPMYDYAHNHNYKVLLVIEEEPKEKTLYKIFFEIRGHGDHIINGMTFYISAPNKKIAEMIIFHNLEPMYDYAHNHNYKVLLVIEEEEEAKEEEAKEEEAKEEEAKEEAKEKTTNRRGKTLVYEWLYLDVDTHGDCNDIKVAKNFSIATEEAFSLSQEWAYSNMVCLQKTYIDKNGSLDFTRSYYDSGWIAEDFDDGSSVPKRYIKEVDQWFERNS